jgi:hypothetical protein
MLEVLKIVVSFLSGGLAGALLNEWFRQRREKVQRIQLIERVISPLEGFRLVRQSHAEGVLREVTDLREYQLTMRNSTSTHLQNAEVQFEFPSDDVQALVSLPALSRIALVPVAVSATSGKRVFRWTIPQFPAGDSVEFTFRAVTPSSDKYEYSLNYVGVIFERIVGEPPPARKPFLNTFPGILIIALPIAALAVLGLYALQKAGVIHEVSGEKLTSVKLGGCDLQMVSIFEIYGQHSDSPWHIRHRIINAGTQDCAIQSHALNTDNPTIIKSGEMLDRERMSEYYPKLSEVVVSVGTAVNSRETTSVPIYVSH